MTPEEIVEKCFSLGVILYLEDGKLRYDGSLPSNWIEVVGQWLPYRDHVIEWLKKPSETHRLRMVKVAVAKIKKRMNLPCVHLGELIEKKPSCGCGARHKCAIHGECVVSGNTNRWQICSRCPDYSPLELA